MSLSLLPNALTLFRMVAVAPLVHWLWVGAYQAAFILAVLAGISDLLDGYLARRFHWITRFGGILDPLTDKFFLVSTAGVLAVLGYFPWWLFTLVMLRDLVIIGGAFYYHYRVTRISRADPTPLSKLNTLLQILLIVGIMWGLAYGGAVQNWVGGLIYVVAASTVASGLQYVIVWSRKAREHDDP